jgi:hypothetical protein
MPQTESGAIRIPREMPRDPSLRFGMTIAGGGTLGMTSESGPRLIEGGARTTDGGSAHGINEFKQESYAKARGLRRRRFECRMCLLRRQLSGGVLACSNRREGSKKDSDIRGETSGAGHGEHGRGGG